MNLWICIHTQEDLGDGMGDGGWEMGMGEAQLRSLYIDAFLAFFFPFFFFMWSKRERSERGFRMERLFKYRLISYDQLSLAGHSLH